MKTFILANDRTELVSQIAKWKKSGFKIVFTNGCFDLLHDGHKALLAFSKEQDGKVVVGLNGDGSVARLKGNGRPVNKLDIRVKNLFDTQHVDAIAVFDDDTPQKLIDLIEPDVLIKGDDYRIETTIGASGVLDRGGKVLFFKKIPGVSTSKIIMNNDKNIETISE